MTPEVAAGSRTGKGRMSVRASQALGAEGPSETRNVFVGCMCACGKRQMLMSEGASQAREREEVIG